MGVSKLDRRRQLNSVFKLFHLGIGFWQHNQYRFVVPILLLLLWEAASQLSLIADNILPAPSQIAIAWLDWIFGLTGTTETHSGRWLIDAGNSGMRVLLGYAIASIFGVFLGLAIGWWKFVETAIESTIQLLRPIPPVAWIPIAIIWFGIANKPAIFLVFIGAFFPILMNTVYGVKTIDKNLVRAAKMMGTDRWQLVRFVVLPAALPSIFAGMRIAVGTAWMLTVTAEMVAVKSGLGYVLWDSYYFLRFDLVIASMVSIGVLGFTTDYVLQQLINRCLYWQQGTHI